MPLDCGHASEAGYTTPLDIGVVSSEDDCAKCIHSGADARLCIILAVDWVIAGARSELRVARLLFRLWLRLL